MERATGKWWVEKSENVDDFLKAYGMSRLKIQKIKISSAFTQDIKMVQDKMTILYVGGEGIGSEKIKFRAGQAGETVKMHDIVGEEVFMSSAWSVPRLPLAPSAHSVGWERSLRLQRARPFASSYPPPPTTPPRERPSRTARCTARAVAGRTAASWTLLAPQ